MAGRAGRVLLSAGLVLVTLAGGAGGYGLGHLTQPEERPSGTASPLGPGTGTPTPVEPRNVAVPDPTPALKRNKLQYKEREFTSELTVRSQVTVDVPKNWPMTMSAETPNEARFTDPAAKRFIRIKAGFTIEEPPAAALAARIAGLAATPYRANLKIVSKVVANDKRSATLVYTWIPDRTLRYVMVRWVALDDSGNSAVEIGTGGLDQDREALDAVLDRASETVTRSDSSL
ncbi:hypothetical protein [Kribbella sp. NPDC051770]|uniref:hypothetical protein n=1 Tax=Kribbella sp. NPDC051770 TaxID=3155413 RepID=UPI003425392E